MDREAKQTIASIDAYMYEFELLASAKESLHIYWWKLWFCFGKTQMRKTNKPKMTFFHLKESSSMDKGLLNFGPNHLTHIPTSWKKNTNHYL